MLKNPGVNFSLIELNSFWEIKFTLNVDTAITLLMFDVTNTVYIFCHMISHVCTLNKKRKTLFQCNLFEICK